jgi:hypothetical protein
VGGRRPASIGRCVGGCVGGAAIKPVDARREEQGFIPVKVDPRPDPFTSAIRIEVRRATAMVTVTWPMTAAAECAAWMRELLK